MKALVPSVSFEPVSSLPASCQFRAAATRVLERLALADRGFTEPFAVVEHRDNFFSGNYELRLVRVSLLSGTIPEYGTYITFPPVYALNSEDGYQ